MRKKTLMICSLLVSAMAFAAERQAVWPEGKIPDFQKHQYAATTKERAQEGFKVSEWTMPYLDWYDAPAAEVRSDACMILISGSLRYGISYLEVGFTLRCLQRLSLPHLATQPCHWHDNWCTSGASIPVLSY